VARLLTSKQLTLRQSPEDGFLLDHKARRGDLQEQYGDTYAATLVARPFRAFMTLACAFNLKAMQYVAPNASLIAFLDRTLCVRTEARPRHKQFVLLFNREITRGQPCKVSIVKDRSAQRIAVMTRTVPQSHQCFLVSNLHSLLRSAFEAGCRAEPGTFPRPVGYGACFR
jgi:hypothetical protein